MARKELEVNKVKININTIAGEDYVCLTDMVRHLDGDARDYIRNWLRRGATIEYMGVWEKVHNKNFNVVEFNHIRTEFIKSTFLMSTKKWIERTKAIGLQAKSGRYGGTYAHSDIAIQFATWLSPEFSVYLTKEFQRLKKKEAEEAQEQLEWNIKRILSKVNYRIHTDAIKSNLIPQRIRGTREEGFTYANEADLLNEALFGMTAKQWRAANPKKKGNIRDHATAEQLLVLANLETLNAEFIKEKLAPDERLAKLNDAAIYQMQLLTSLPTLQNLKNK